MFRATERVNVPSLIIFAISVILVTLIAIPFFVLPLIAYPFGRFLLLAYGTGFFVLIPFLRIDKTIQGIAFGTMLVLSSWFVSFTGILFTYYADLRLALIITIPILFSVLAIYYIQKYSKEWNVKFDSQTSSNFSMPV